VCPYPERPRRGRAHRRLIAPCNSPLHRRRSHSAGDAHACPHHNEPCAWWWGVPVGGRSQRALGRCAWNL